MPRCIVEVITSPLSGNACNYTSKVFYYFIVSLNMNVKLSYYGKSLCEPRKYCGEWGPPFVRRPGGILMPTPRI